MARDFRNLVFVVFVVFVAATAAVGCTKNENAGSGPGIGSTPSGGVTSSATPVPLASSAAAQPKAAPELSAHAAADDDAGARAKRDAGAGAKLEPAKAHIEGKNFTLDVASPGCRASEECAVTLKLVTAAEYHVNKEYPYKFIAAASPGVAYLGKPDAHTFSKAAGDLKEEGEKSATLTVRFKPSAPGEAKVTGTYKLSVCSAEQCQIEQQPVSIGVPVI